ncbi:Arylsulfatase [Planctomycetes bacterium Pan216]|uniref:Arylsulfatase n=1 Tax=Kolteria novifilia TaxID=2527975 RepID=A0A518B9C8_9BACT|nr:Arylsulfatase [Planctomycetes bacterium Pan216]
MFFPNSQQGRLRRRRLPSLGRLFLVVLTFVGAAVADSVARADEANERPNFVVFLADDLGWGDLGCYGHEKIQTPNLDKFAKQGLRMTQCYSACSVCSPSRSSILTGRTPYRNGVWRWIPDGSKYHLRPSEITVAKLLKDQGYATCHVGKWHLNGKFNSSEQPQPGDHGYDWWMATQNNAAPTHKNPTNFVRNGEPVGPLEGFSAELVADEAIDWLQHHRDKEKPFFLTVWTHEPHLPIESNPKFMELYKDADDPGIRQHHGNVTQLDHAFGKLMKELEEQGLDESTFVIFTSDNGPEGSGEPFPKNPQSQRNRTRGSTGGLRGRKRSTFDGGIRVPGIVRWPGKVKPGTETKEPVIGSDIFTTICDIVGVPVPSDRTIDGASMLPLFEGNQIEREQPLYWRNHLSDDKHMVALRDGDWKVIGSSDMTHFELYNLADDWQETADVAKKFPVKFAEMKRKLIDHDAAVLADGPDWWKNDPHARKRKQPKPKKKAKPTT